MEQPQEESVTLKGIPAAEHVQNLVHKALRLDIAAATGKILDLRVQLPAGAHASLLVAPLADEFAAECHGENASRDQFTIAHAWGADECFPTVTAHAAPPLRDHGELWGRHAQTRTGRSGNETSPPEGRHETVWQLPFATPQGEPLTFHRTLSTTLPTHPAMLSSWPAAALLGHFHTRISFPSRIMAGLDCLEGLYAAHALYQAEEGDLFTVRAATGADTIFTPSAEVVWEGVFPAPSAPGAQKFYVNAPRGMVLGSCLERRRLGIEVWIVHVRGLPSLGVWWCNDAWGDGRTHRTIGIEPTTHPSDGPVFSGRTLVAQETTTADFVTLVTLSGARPSGWP